MAKPIATVMANRMAIAMATATSDRIELTPLATWPKPLPIKELWIPHSLTQGCSTQGESREGASRLK